MILFFILAENYILVKKITMKIAAHIALNLIPILDVYY